MEHFDAQVAKRVNFIVCSTHKTSHVYGDVSKWLAPGTIDAVTCGRACPAEMRKTFLDGVFRVASQKFQFLVRFTCSG